MGAALPASCIDKVQATDTAWHATSRCIAEVVARPKALFA